MNQVGGSAWLGAVQPLSLPMSVSSAALWPLGKGWFQEAARDRVRDHLCGAGPLVVLLLG